VVLATSNTPDRIGLSSIIAKHKRFVKLFGREFRDWLGLVAIYGKIELW
jgi:hypothetical protein